MKNVRKDNINCYSTSTSKDYFFVSSFQKMYFPSDLIAFLFEVLHPPGRFNVTSRHFLVPGPLRRFKEAQQAITGLSSKADTVCLIYCNFKNHLQQSMSLPYPSAASDFYQFIGMQRVCPGTESPIATHGKCITCY